MKQQLGAGLKGTTGYKNSANCCCESLGCMRFKHALGVVEESLTLYHSIKKRIPFGTRFKHL